MFLLYGLEKARRIIVVIKRVMLPGRKIWIVRRKIKARFSAIGFGSSVIGCRMTASKCLRELPKIMKYKKTDKIPVSVARFRRKEEEVVKRIFQ